MARLTVFVMVGIHFKLSVKAEFATQLMDGANSRNKYNSTGQLHIIAKMTSRVLLRMTTSSRSASVLHKF